MKMLFVVGSVGHGVSHVDASSRCSTTDKVNKHDVELADGR
jgi:hypothetical protein